MRINEKRPIEELVGDNRGRVRYRLGNLHVGNSLLAAARCARPKGMRNYPVALRRGWALCVIQTWQQYRNEYAFVMWRRDEW